MCSISFRTGSGIEMISPPCIQLTCSQISFEKFERLQTIFTLSGFLLLNHEHRKNKSIFTICRSREINRSNLIKLFKQLQREFKISKFSLPENKISEFEEFSRSPGLILSGTGIRSYLIRSEETVRKYYIEQGEFYQRELLARDELAHLPSVTPIIRHADNWFDMPYITTSFTWDNKRWPRLFPISLFDQIYRFVEDVYDAGYCLVDWNPDSFIFSSDGLFMVDFEYLYKHSCPDKYPVSPDITGIGQERTTTANDIVTFDTTWKQVLGFSHQEYLNCSTRVLKLKRMNYYVLKLLPKFGLKKLNPIVKSIKDSLRYKISSDQGLLIVQKRFD